MVPYVYQEFPRSLYKSDGESSFVCIVVDDEAGKEAALADGWKLSPSELGIETEPGAPVE